MPLKRRRRRRRPLREITRKRKRQIGWGLKELLVGAAKIGVKLGRDKRYKRMGALGARGHYRSNPRPWAV